MVLAALIILGISLLTSLTLNSFLFHKVLGFLERNQTVGGTPLAVVKAQQEHQKELSIREEERLKEFRSLNGHRALSD